MGNPSAMFSRAVMTNFVVIVGVTTVSAAMETRGGNESWRALVGRRAA
jgi:hypothetical protein